MRENIRPRITLGDIKGNPPPPRKEMRIITKEIERNIKEIDHHLPLVHQNGSKRRPLKYLKKSERSRRRRGRNKISFRNCGRKELSVNARSHRRSENS